MRAILTAAAALLVADAAPAAPLDLYDWLGPAPIVAVVEIVRDDGRFTEARIERSLRGDLEPATVVGLDVRGANRDREGGTPALELTRERRYVVLMRPATEGRAGKAGAYVLVRGTRGAREVPAETGAALESAVVRLVEIQGARDLDLAWRRLGEALLDPNPWLAETALDQHLKFRRGEPELLAPGRALLSSPGAGVRARAAALVGLVLGRGALPDELAAQAVADLAAAARRDPEPGVREAATRALGASPRSDALEVLRTIARDDPDQRVRYAAELALFERSVRGGRVD